MGFIVRFGSIAIVFSVYTLAKRYLLSLAPQKKDADNLLASFLDAMLVMDLSLRGAMGLGFGYKLLRWLHFCVCWKVEWVHHDVLLRHCRLKKDSSVVQSWHSLAVAYGRGEWRVELDLASSSSGGGSSSSYMGEFVDDIDYACDLRFWYLVNEI